MNRRSFLHISAVSVAGALLPVAAGKADEPSPDKTPRVRADATPNTWVTANEDFYVQDITAGNPPALDAASWKLIVNGLVEKPRILRYGDLMAMASRRVTEHRTLSCIGDPLGGNQIGNAEWTGVPLRAVLEEAGLREGATRAVFRCADGYHTAIPLRDAMRPDCLLAYGMNGGPLPAAHGFPLRLLNPGKYGQKCPKWIINVELVAREHLGYWETRGWSDVAAVKTATRVHAPGRGAELPPGVYRISGSAFDGGNGGGIARVEVSTDGGKTWDNAEIWASGTPLTWSLWVYEWSVPRGLRHAKILARAVDRRGNLQPSKHEDPYPSGAGGYHTVEVDIVS
jgi:DMSO/TMAO reductase YedYZ molybdopterin-dependent catalytic subunit